VVLDTPGAKCSAGPGACVPEIARPERLVACQPIVSFQRRGWYKWLLGILLAKVQLPGMRLPKILLAAGNVPSDD